MSTSEAAKSCMYLIVVKMYVLLLKICVMVHDVWCCSILKARQCQYVMCQDLKTAQQNEVRL